MAKITVKLFASLAKYKPSQADESTFAITVAPGNTVEQAILEMGLPLEKVRTVSVNQEVVKLDHHLYDGDIVTLFPTIAGG